jgi:hypothetical protein
MQVQVNGIAVWWEGPLAVDADGAPNAYGPDNTGLDLTANAGHPGDWYGIVTVNGEPVVQGPNDPYPGFYVSTTALVDHGKAETDPRRYVNSVEVPYLSIPSNSIKEFGLSVGDVGFAYCRHTGRMAAAVVADVGPRDKYGEGSIALACALGLSGSPRNGGTESGVVCCVFRGTGRGWPRSASDVAQQVEDVINGLGGTPVYETIIAPQS